MRRLYDLSYYHYVQHKVCMYTYYTIVQYVNKSLSQNNLAVKDPKAIFTDT